MQEKDTTKPSLKPSLESSWSC